MADRPQVHQVAHPTPLTYFKVAMTLAALTGLEVGVFYVDSLESLFLPIFILLSIVKFTLVVMFYMHLKFDNRLFSGVFVGGLLLAIIVSIALMALFQTLTAVSNPPEAEHGRQMAPADETLTLVSAAGDSLDGRHADTLYAGPIAPDVAWGTAVLRMRYPMYFEGAPEAYG